MEVGGVRTPSRTVPLTKGLPAKSHPGDSLGCRGGQCEPPKDRDIRKRAMVAKIVKELSS